MAQILTQQEGWGKYPDWTVPNQNYDAYASICNGRICVTSTSHRIPGLIGFLCASQEFPLCDLNAELWNLGDQVWELERDRKIYGFVFVFVMIWGGVWCHNSPLGCSAYEKITRFLLVSISPCVQCVLVSFLVNGGPKTILILHTKPGAFLAERFTFIPYRSTIRHRYLCWGTFAKPTYLWRWVSPSHFWMHE